ncbi:MAG TPA: HEAT repeat domain-containing protein, partial [Elusimicrobiota bacterium]|nr:HEAT repeat domain-containing protein [Elusimicrobiota bacterium]
AAAAAAPAPDRTSGPAEPDEEPLPESHEQVITADVPRPPRRPSARRPSPPAAPAAPTKDERYAELDAILDAPAAPRETLDAAPPVARRARRTSAAAPAMTAPARLAERAELSRRRTDAPQTLPRPAVATPIPEAAVEAPASFEAAGGKAPHDAVPDLLLTLKRGGAAARSRAADELGQYGAAASSAVPALIAALRDKSPRVRASASLALGNIGSGIDGVVPLLVKALKDKNLDVRYAATLALSRIATPAARAAFKKHIGEDARRAIEQRPAGTGAARP